MVLLFCGLSCLFIWGRPLAALEKVTSALAQEPWVESLASKGQQAGGKCQSALRAVAFFDGRGGLEKSLGKERILS